MLRVILLLSLGSCALFGGGKADDDDDDDDDDDESGGDGNTTALLVVTDNSSTEQDLARTLLLADLSALLPGDWRLGFTTVSADPVEGATSGVDPGEAGTLIGPPLTPDTPDVAVEVQRAIACGGMCWDEDSLEHDPDYVCDEVPVYDGTVSQDYLNCLCGVSGWQACGVGNEEGLEAVKNNLCFGVDAPPESCAGELATLVGGAGAHSLFSGASAVAVWVITTEGDSSRGLDNGDSDPAAYLTIYEEIGLSPVISVLGPNYADGEIRCNSGGAQPWGIDRYQNVVTATGGLYLPVEQEVGDDCAIVDIATSLERFADLW